jgi:hypothetical protein
MRSISRYLSIGVIAVVANACERPTGPTSTPATVLAEAMPNASVSDAVNGGRLGFYFLPSLVPAPGAFPGTFDGTLEPYVNICALVDQDVGCGDGEMLVTLPFRGDKPGGVSVDASSETYNANWNKPTLDVGKYRIYVNVTVPLPETSITRQVGLGFVDLQVMARKKDPVDAGFVGVVKGAPIPVKFRIEANTVGGIALTNGTRRIPVGRVGFMATIVFDLHGTAITCPTMTWTSSNPAVASVVIGNAPTIGAVTGISVGTATITATCRGVSQPFPAVVPAD